MPCKYCGDSTENICKDSTCNGYYCNSIIKGSVNILCKLTKQNCIKAVIKHHGLGGWQDLLFSHCEHCIDILLNNKIITKPKITPRTSEYNKFIAIIKKKKLDQIKCILNEGIIDMI